jgi:hypothetical protein
VLRDHVSHLVADHRRELILVPSHREEPRVDADLPARKRERVRRVVPEDHDLPRARASALEPCDDGGRDAARAGLERRIALDRHLALHLVERSHPELGDLGVGEEQKALASERGGHAGDDREPR